MAQKTFHRLVQAETLRAATWWAYKQDYPQEHLEDSWRDLLFNDFHDILTGTCIEPAEQDALNLYGKVSETTKRIRLEAATEFNRGQSQDLSIPVTVMNTNTGITIAPVEVECMISHRPLQGPWHLKLFTLDGQEIPITRLGLLFNKPPSAQKKQPIVIVRKGSERLGLAVDSVADTQEVVVKPLNRFVRESRYFSGSTIVGSGEAVLILDAVNLILSKRTYAAVRDAAEAQTVPALSG